MCVMSMVIDHYKPMFPEVTTLPYYQEPLVDLRKIIDDFKKAREAAEVVDKLTGKSDCVDPEKAKLLDRIADLERRLTNAGCAQKELWFIYHTKAHYPVDASMAYSFEDAKRLKAEQFPGNEFAIVGPFRLES